MEDEDVSEVEDVAAVVPTIEPTAASPKAMQQQGKFI